MKEKKKKLAGIPKGSRKLHINGEVWHWKHNGSNNIVVSPERKKYVVSDYKIPGAYVDDHYYSITPGMVKEYIEGNLI